MSVLQIPASVLRATIELCAIVALRISRKSDCGLCIARIHDTDRKSHRPIFSTICNIYISRLCYDVSVRLSVCDESALAHYS